MSINIFSNIFNIYRRYSFFSMPLYKITRKKTFWETYNTLKKYETAPNEDIVKWQLAQLQEIVSYAYNHVPFYNNLYKKNNFHPEDFKSIEDFSKIPYVSKEDVKKNLELFQSDEINKIPHLWRHTSGSQDAPMKFSVDKYILDREMAYYYYYWEKYGYHIGTRCISIRGNKVANLRKKKFFQRDNITNIIEFDSYYLSDHKYFDYYDMQIKKLKGKILSGYTSSIYTLAKNYEDNKVVPPSFELVILASENTYPDQVKYIKKIFQAKNVIYAYGHSEKILLAFKYYDNNQLGFSPTYGYMEFENNKDGEIIGTGFNNKSMPLIRYKTGDFSSKSNYHSQDFMKNYVSVDRIEGRSHEFILTKDGRKISLVNVAGAHISELAVVKDVQYEQTNIGELIVKYTSFTSHIVTKEEEILIKQALESKFDNSITISVKKIDEIEKTKNNKKIVLKQFLKI